MISRKEWRSNHCLRKMYRIILDEEITSFIDFDALCARDDPDGIDIRTHSYLHFQHTRQALAAGKHVICDKPIAGSLKEADVPGPTHEHQEARRGHGQMKPVNREGTV